MNELQELQIKGQLSEKGFLDEKYDFLKGDLVHTLTDKGNKSTKDLLKNRGFAREFLKMAGQEALKHDRQTAKKIIEEALQKIKEANK